MNKLWKRISLDQWNKNVDERVKINHFLRRLLDPEDLGHAVTAEVRDEARVLMGMERVET